MAAANAKRGSDRNRLILVIVAAVIAVILFSGWMMHRGTVAVTAEKAVRQEIASVISTNGKIEPTHNFEAHAPVAATVKQVFVHEGDQVKPGQLLLRLDDANARAQAARALAQLKAAEADLSAVAKGGTQEEVLTNRSDLIKAQAERDDARRNLEAVQRLQKTGAASPAEVEEAGNRLKKAEADVLLLQSKQTSRYSNPEVAKVEASASEARAAYAAAQELLKNSNVTAPFAGSVYQLAVKAGSYVSPGDLLVQVANLDNVQVRAFVDEPEIGRLAQGQKVQITWDALPGRVWEGELTKVPTVVTNLGTRTVGEVSCAILNTDHKLLPNVNVNVNIVTALHSKALTVSREAVHDVDGKRFVYKIVDDRLRAQPVETGISSLTRVEVLKGLPEGTEIARSALNAQPLQDDMEVKVTER